MTYHEVFFCFCIGKEHNIKIQCLQKKSSFTKEVLNGFQKSELAVSYVELSSFSLGYISDLDIKHRMILDRDYQRILGRTIYFIHKL